MVFYLGARQTAPRLLSSDPVPRYQDVLTSIYCSRRLFDFQHSKQLVLLPVIPWRIGILGPRAEATMPIRSWLELCAIFPEAAFHLHLCGPEVPESLHEKEESVHDDRLRITVTIP